MVRSLTEPGSGSLPLATLVVAIVFTVICCVVVGLRIVAARLRKRSFKLHDYFIFVALLASIAGCVATGVAVYHGALGRHITTASISEMVNLLKILSGSSVLWIVSTASVKASVISLLWNLFPKKSFRRALTALSVLVAIWFIGFLIEPFIICQPYTFYWRRLYNPEGGSCGNQFNEEIAAASTNMLIDLILVMMPMPILWNLQMSTAKKVRVSLVLSLGWVICAVNIARIIYTVYASEIDFTYSGSITFILAEMEVWVGIVVACLPLLGPLVRSKTSTSKPTFPSSGFRSTTSSWAMRLLSFTQTRASRTQASGSDESKDQSSANYTGRPGTLGTLGTSTTVSTSAGDYRNDGKMDEVYAGQPEYEVVHMDKPARSPPPELEQELDDGASGPPSEKDVKHSHDIV